MKSRIRSKVKNGKSRAREVRHRRDAERREEGLWRTGANVRGAEQISARDVERRHERTLLWPRWAVRSSPSLCMYTGVSRSSQVERAWRMVALARQCQTIWRPSSEGWPQSQALLSAFPMRWSQERWGPLPVRVYVWAESAVLH